MFAGSQLDMCIGLDIHMEMVPMPAPVPTPFPMPFVGQVELSVTGVLMGMGIGKAMSFVTGAPPTGPVLVNGFHAVKTGDEAKNAETLPHFVIPPGTMWTPLPKPLKLKISPPPPKPDNPAAPPGDAVFITGSKTVHFEQSSACRLGTLAMSCSDPVRLPSSVLMAVPKGLPVLVGGPPAIDWTAAAKAFFLRNKWTAGLLHQLVSLVPSERLRNLLAKGVCMFTGHPVDVATGRLLTWSEDFLLRGPLALPFERNYSSGWAERPSTLGYGWSHTYDERIWVERGRVVYLTGDGRELEFHTHELPGRVMREGQELFYPIDRLTLRCVGKGHWSIRSADGLLREFEVAAAGEGRTSQLARITDRLGHSIRFVYRAGYLDRVETSEGRAIRFEHRGGRLVRIAVPAGQVDGWYDQIRFAYSEDGDLIASYDSASNATTYLYEGHLLVRERDRDGVTFWFEYDGRDSAARCVRTWGSDGMTTDRLMYRDISYDIAGRRTFVEDSLGNTTVYSMNVANSVIEVIDPHGGKQKNEYSDVLWKTAEVDAAGQTTNFAYDSRGNETYRRYPDGGEVRSTYSAEDLPLRMLDRLGCEWKWAYDAQSRLIQQWNSALETLRFVYEGRVLRRVVRPDERSFEFDYDSEENLRRVTFADGTQLENWYDRQGRLEKTRDALGRVQRFMYDGESRLVHVDEPGGIWRHFTRTPDGDLCEYKDNLRRFALSYCGFHKVARREEAGDSVSLAYSTEGTLVAVVNELGEAYQLVRDACQRVTEEVGFDGRTHLFLRDATGRVTTTIKPGKSAQRFAYDPVGRLTQVDYADGTRDEFTHDLAGNLLSARNRAGEVAWKRDQRGRVLRESFGEGWIESTYETIGLRIGITTSRGFEQKILRSAMGEVVAEELRDNTRDRAGMRRWRMTAERDALGREVARNLPGHITVGRSYHESGTPKTVEINRGDTPLSLTTYSWDGDSQLRRQMRSGVGDIAFAHDTRGRLTSMSSSDGSVQRRDPDAAGRLFKSSDRQGRRYGQGGILLEAEGTSFAYDGDGNLVERKSPDGARWRYSWSADGTLARVALPDGEEVSFSYDALRRRIIKRAPGGTTRWQWDGDVPVHETLERGDAFETTTWAFDGLQPIAKLAPDGRAYSIVNDYLGAPREMVDEVGTMAWEAQLDAYGVARSVKGTPEDCPWRWPGQYDDADTGLYYNRFRYYDPERGDYIGQDPVRLLAGIQLYGYVPDPTLYIDPFGLALSGINFANSPSLYNGDAGTPIVQIPLQGSRGRDFTQANIAGGFDTQPAGYTWHHLDDFDPATGMSTMQLVETGAHSSVAHGGSVAQFQQEFGVKYDTAASREISEQQGWQRDAREQRRACAGS